MSRRAQLEVGGGRALEGGGLRLEARKDSGGDVQDVQSVQVVRNERTGGRSAAIEDRSIEP